MPNILLKIIANSPPAILIAIGGVGWLMGISGYGFFLVPGIILQVFWLRRRFI